MNEIPTDQLVFLVILAIMIAFVLPMLSRYTGKSMSEMFFGSRFTKSKHNPAKPVKPPYEPKLSNGKQSDLTVFISQLLNTAKKNKMQLVTPGTIEYKGKSARLLALVVHPSGVTGVYCLGFGGTITPATQSGKPWKQHMNGEDKTFDNPLDSCNEQYQLVRAAMDDAGIKADLNIVAVFTNAHATLAAKPQNVYTKKEFFKYLSETSALKNGDVDIKATALALADLAHINDKKKAK